MFRHGLSVSVKISEMMLHSGGSQVLVTTFDDNKYIIRT